MADDDEVQDESYWCEEVFEKFEFAVVRLHIGGEFSGNGFIVHHGDDGTTCLILTCRHVLGNVPVGGIMAAYFSGSTDVHYDATVPHFDHGRDLALLRATQVLEPVTPLKFFDAPIVSGWNVVALSFITMGANAILEPGTFYGEITNEPDDAYLHCNCTSKQGASGSPIILAGVNQVVAVLAGSSLASVDAIPVRTIQEFLRVWLKAEDLLNVSTNGLVMIAAVKD